MWLKLRTSIVATFIQLIVTLTALVVSCTLAKADNPPVIEWQLTDAKVTSWGTMSTLKEGNMRTGIQIETKADTATPGALFSRGVFKIEMTAFSPFKDMAGQKKGRWYLRGSWTITTKDADAKTAKARYSPYLLTGLLSSTLLFDPATKNGTMAAQSRLQRGGTRPRVERSGTAGYTYTGDTTFNGILTTPFIPMSQEKKENIL
jgi:hypothetical protein